MLVLKSKCWCWCHNLYFILDHILDHYTVYIEIQNYTGGFQILNWHWIQSKITQFFPNHRGASSHILSQDDYHHSNFPAWQLTSGTCQRSTNNFPIPKIPIINTNTNKFPEWRLTSGTCQRTTNNFPIPMIPIPIIFQQDHLPSTRVNDLPIIFQYQQYQ